MNNDVPEGFKRCPKCGYVKAIGEFSRHKGRSDGLDAYCKVCQRERDRHRREENPEKARERDRRYRQKNLEKRLKSNRRYHQENLESERERKRRYYQENAEKVRETKRRWRQENPEKAREVSRRYYQENLQKVRERNHRRRARVLAAVFSVPDNIEAILWDAQNGQCMYCGCDLTGGYHVDHIIPVALANLLGDKHPGHTPTNLALACPHCNRSKCDSLLKDWLIWKYPDQMDEILHRVAAHIAIMQEWEKEEGDG